MEAAVPDVAAYVVGGFLLFGTGVLLLFHCSSISHRKKRQRVEHGPLNSGMQFNSRKQFLRPWRNNKRKSGPVLHIFDVPSVIITPPSPSVSPRGTENDSIGSTSDLVRNIVMNQDSSSAEDKPCPDTRDSGDVTQDVTSGGSSRGGSASLGESSSLDSSSSTNGSSSSGKHSRGKDSQTGCNNSTRTWQRSVLSLTDAETDDLLEEEPVAMRPRLSSMEPGTSKKDFNIPALVHQVDK